MDKRKTPKRHRCYITPNAYINGVRRRNAKMEANTLPVPQIDLRIDMTFFGNKPREAIELGYDQFFAYTKTLPLYDQRKAVENRGSMWDMWKNIHDQEKPPKAVPATTSQWYGRRPGYDPDILKFERQCQTKAFFSKHGGINTRPPTRYSEKCDDTQL